MILRTRYGGDVELRADYGTSHIVPSPLSGYWSASGVAVTTDRAFGLPAAMRAVKLVSEFMAGMTLSVYRGKGPDKTEDAGSWQAQLFARPHLDLSDFDWKSDSVSAIEGFGNAVSLKRKSTVGRTRGRVVELEPVHPDYVRIYRDRDNGEKLFDIYYEGRTITKLTASDVLHIRGFALGCGTVGLSPVQAHRHALGEVIATEEFAGSYFRNDARPSMVATFPQGVTPEQAKVWQDKWVVEHGGPANRWKPTAIGGGATITTVSTSLEDAQFIEGRGYGIEQIARIFGVPAWALDHTEQSETAQTTEQKRLTLLTFYLWPRIVRFQRALASDPDLFGPSDGYPEFVMNEWTAVDAAARSAADHQAIQSGWKLRDEVRAEHGYGPLPGGVGQIPVVTPVGAGPNPDPMPEPPSQE